MRRFFAPLVAGALLSHPALAATSIWSNVVGGFPTWYGAPTFAANVYTLTAPLPQFPAYSLVNQQHVRIIVPSGGTNTAAVTLNVNATGALPVVENTESGLSALVGGELVAGLEYDVTYSTSAAAACSNSCYVLSWLAQAPVLAGTTQTITAGQWAVVSSFDVTSSGQTLTLPATANLSANGGINVNTGIAGVTIAPGSGDVITYGSVVYATNVSVLLPAGTLAFITKSSAGNIAISATSTFAMASSAALTTSAYGGN